MDGNNTAAKVKLLTRSLTGSYKCFLLVDLFIPFVMDACKQFAILLDLQPCKTVCIGNYSEQILTCL